MDWAELLRRTFGPGGRSLADQSPRRRLTASMNLPSTAFQAGAPAAVSSRDRRRDRLAGLELQLVDLRPGQVGVLAEIVLLEPVLEGALGPGPVIPLRIQQEHLFGVGIQEHEHLAGVVIVGADRDELARARVFPLVFVQVLPLRDGQQAGVGGVAVTVALREAAGRSGGALGPVAVGTASTPA
ncbi:hypothetical protein BON30_06010 [Cystobacter ferrugineus]|uniref:Uncharacterized protein n=1 Tax=Cystobacter ferrugineus TaxID=83449 RepID=A0A1L9BKC0_9BACT|nr:hypothetical protein BON30_06010 [Cystobacter ferrugineus]